MANGKQVWVVVMATGCVEVFDSLEKARAWIDSLDTEENCDFYKKVDSVNLCYIR